MLSLDKFYHAAYVLKSVLRRTDLVYAPELNPEADIYLKPERRLLQDRYSLR